MHESEFAEFDSAYGSITREEYYRLLDEDDGKIKIQVHKGTLSVENNPNIVIRDKTKPLGSLK